MSEALNVVTQERCVIYFRSARRYLELYAKGVEGRDIPEAMQQMRKHRKHRVGDLLDDDHPSQRGKNSHKKSRIEKLR